MKNLFRFKTKEEYIETVGINYETFGPGWSARIDDLFGMIISEEYNYDCLQLVTGLVREITLVYSPASYNVYVYVCKEMITLINKI